MIVDKDDLSISIIPQAKHYINQCLSDYFRGNNHRARHAHVMVRMTTIVDWSKSQIYLSALFGGITPHSFTDLGNHKRIKSAISMIAMIFCTTDWE